jgi:hypothetical protein
MFALLNDTRIMQFDKIPYIEAKEASPFGDSVLELFAIREAPP